MRTKDNLLKGLWVALIVMGLLAPTSLAQEDPVDITSRVDAIDGTLEEVEALADRFAGETVSYLGFVQSASLVGDDVLLVELEDYVLCVYEGTDAASLAEQIELGTLLTGTGTVSGVEVEAVAISLEDCTLAGAALEDDTTASDTAAENMGTRPIDLTSDINNIEGSVEELQAIADEYAGQPVSYLGFVSDTALSEDETILIIQLDEYVACIYEGADAADLMTRIEIDNLLIGTGSIGLVDEELVVMTFVDCTFSVDVTADVFVMEGTAEELQAIADQYVDLPVSYFGFVTDVDLEEGILTVQMDDYIVCMYDGADAADLYQFVNIDDGLTVTGMFGEVDAEAPSITMTGCVLEDIDTSIDITFEVDSTSGTAEELQAIADSYEGQMVSYLGFVQDTALTDDGMLVVQLDNYVLCVYGGADAVDRMAQIQTDDLLTATGIIGEVDSELIALVIVDCALTSFGDVEIGGDDSGAIDITFEVDSTSGTAEELQAIADSYEGQMVSYLGFIQDTALTDDGTLVVQLDDYVRCVYDGADAADRMAQIQTDDLLTATGTIGEVDSELIALVIVDCSLEGFGDFSMGDDSGAVDITFDVDFSQGTAEELQAIADQFEGTTVSYFGFVESADIVDDTLQVKLDDYIICVYAEDDFETVAEAMVLDEAVTATGQIGLVNEDDITMTFEPCTSLEVGF